MHLEIPRNIKVRVALGDLLQLPFLSQTSALAGVGLRKPREPSYEPRGLRGNFSYPIEKKIYLGELPHPRNSLIGTETTTAQTKKRGAREQVGKWEWMSGCFVAKKIKGGL